MSNEFTNLPVQKLKTDASATAQAEMDSKIAEKHVKDMLTRDISLVAYHTYKMGVEVSMYSEKGKNGSVHSLLMLLHEQSQLDQLTALNNKSLGRSQLSPTSKV